MYRQNGKELEGQPIRSSTTAVYFTAALCIQPQLQSGVTQIPECLQSRGVSEQLVHTSLSGTSYHQTLPELVTLLKGHSIFIFALLSTDAVSALRKVWVLIRLRTSLSGTFLQTLPELFTPLKGHVLFISAQLSTDAVSALRKVWVLRRHSVESRT